MRFLGMFIGLTVLLLIPFLLWAREIESWWTMEKLGSFGRWAWAVGLALLAGDLLLPIPSTVMMAGLGYLYGFWLGGLLSSLGGILSGFVGYGCCRLLGERAVRFLVGETGLAQGRAWFGRFGGWLVVVSRWLPLLSEAVACLAGFTRMPLRKFAPALICGCVPLGFSFAWIGQMGTDKPFFALAVSALLPPVLWLLSSQFLQSNGNFSSSRKI